MKIKVLGASGGKSSDNMLTCFLINSHIALDAGALCSATTIEEQINIDSVIISHTHMDHISEMPFFVDNLAINGSHVKIYATDITISHLKKYIFNNVIWPDFSDIVINGAPVVTFIPVTCNTPFTIKDIEITPVAVNHIKGSAGFILSDKHQSVAFTSDTGDTHLIWEMVSRDKKCKTVITECSFPDSQKILAEVSRHFCPSTLKENLNRIEGKRDIYIYHLKPQLADEILSSLKKMDISVLHTGDVIDLKP